jgi:NAD(P)-dependent dehydrogenase (short-subunit alcohol dehydrogenase family)
VTGRAGPDFSMRLKNKVILVTGSTTGIGEGIVRLCGKAGATVVVHGTREAAAQELVADLAKQKITSSYVIAPLDDPAAPEKIIAHVIAAHGRIDGLVNNAAVMTRSTLESTDAETFDRTFAINLRAPLLLIRAAFPHMKKRGGGRVLNIGSVNGYCGEATQLAYSMAKGAMITLTRNLADAHGRDGLRVNHFNVGWTLTPNEYALKIKEGLPADWPEKLSRVHAPSGRLLSPEDIAWAAVFFLSDEAQLINGATLDLEQYPLIGRNPPKD